MIQRTKFTLFVVLFFTSIYIFFLPISSVAQNEKPYCPPLDSFKIFPHLPPTTQGYTGTCWSFAMVSLLESEHIRIHHDTTKFSEMWFAYYDFVGKINQILVSPTDTFVEGSECNAVLNYMTKYGAVPAYAYLGRTIESTFFDYSLMFEKLQLLVKKIKRTKNPNSLKIIKQCYKILDQTMTAPPTHFFDTALKRTITPLEYSKEHLKLNPYDYYFFMSNSRLPFGQRGVLDEPDNWWRDKNYYNLPIELFIEALKEALMNGYSVVVSGDLSEKTYQPHIPYSWFKNEIDLSKMDSLRLTEKLNKKTEDDHSWHIIGYYKSKNGWWFYIKDSAFWDNPTNGYHFIHESYFIRKSVSMCMHKYAARSVMNGIIK
jgi:bleomycin hydrolase